VTADLLYSESERALLDSLRSLLADRCGWDKVLARTESAETSDSELWRTVAADLGCAGLLIPEQSGGAGASYREAATAAEALGGFVAPVPFLGSAVVATALLLACDDSAEAGHLIRRMAGGDLTAALAVPFSTAPGAPFPTSMRLGERRG